MDEIGMNVSIIIPNYNGETLLQKNLPRVLTAAKTYSGGKVEIIIPDDPSTDRSEEVIHAFIASLKGSGVKGKTVSNRNKKRAGFSHNVNRGVALADGEIIVLLNSDVIPQKGFLEPLLREFADEKVFAVGCLDETEEKGKTILRGRGIGKWRRGFLNHAAGKLDKDYTLWASGGSSAFRKNTWDKLQGMDQLYDPFYWEDIDLSYRALKSGYRICFVKESVVKHEHDKGTIQTTFTPTQIKRTAYRNQFIFVWKNVTDPGILLSHLFWLPYHMIKSAISGDWAFFIGFYWALLRLPTIMQKRSFANQYFIKTDAQILAANHT